MIKPYKISVPKSTLNTIYKKVKAYPWKMMQNLNGWEYGTNYNFLKKISQYWVSKYNWRKFENKINSFQNYKTNVDGINIHFIKEKSKNPKVDANKISSNNRGSKRPHKFTRTPQPSLA